MKKQLIIVGGGTSIREGISKSLWKKLKNKYVIGINYSHKYFSNPTIQCYVDKKFYDEEKDNMKYLPLIIGKKHGDKILPNTIAINSISKYNRDIKKSGVYKSTLCGLFALTLGIYLLDEGEIYLLGFDYGEARKSDFTKTTKNPSELNKIMIRDKKNRPFTHFYQEEMNHRGIGKINYYNAQGRAGRDFGVYRSEKKVKIFNVSKISKIPDDIFPKISYNEFFERLNKENYNQDELRKEIRRKLK